MKSKKKGAFSWGQFLFLAIVAGVLFYFLPKYLNQDGGGYKASSDISHGIREGNAQSARPDRWGGN